MKAVRTFDLNALLQSSSFSGDCEEEGGEVEEEEEDEQEEDEDLDDVVGLTAAKLFPLISLSPKKSPVILPCHATPTHTLRGIDACLKRSRTVGPHSLSQ